MGHYIYGFIARDETIDFLAKSLSIAEEEAAIADLPQGFQLFFMTGFVIDAITKRFGNPTLCENSHHLTNGMIDFIRHTHGENSAADDLAFIETEYFGGDGTQYAVLFGKDGMVKTLFLPEDEEWTGKYPQYPEDLLAWPINTVLREIGVVRDAGKDEFDTLELVAFRHMPAEPDE